MSTALTIWGKFLTILTYRLSLFELISQVFPFRSSAAWWVKNSFAVCQLWDAQKTQRVPNWISRHKLSTDEPLHLRDKIWGTLGVLAFYLRPSNQRSRPRAGETAELYSEKVWSRWLRPTLPLSFHSRQFYSRLHSFFFFRTQEVFRL